MDHVIPKQHLFVSILNVTVNRKVTQQDIPLSLAFKFIAVPHPEPQPQLPPPPSGSAGGGNPPSESVVGEVVDGVVEAVETVVVDPVVAVATVITDIFDLFDSVPGNANYYYYIPCGTSNCSSDLWNEREVTSGACDSTTIPSIKFSYGASYTCGGDNNLTTLDDLSSHVGSLRETLSWSLFGFVLICSVRL